MAMIHYRFPYLDGEEVDFEYEIDREDFSNFIEEHIPFDDQVDIYIGELYNKDEREREMMARDFEINSEEEMRDFLYTDDYGSDWLIDTFLDSNELSDFICNEYDYELEEEFKDDAEEAWAEELEAELDDQAFRDEMEAYWRKTRL